MKLKRSYLKNGLILLHILFAFIGFYTYLFNYKLSENLLIQKTLSKQSIIAKAGSLSVENLLKSVRNDLDSFIFSFAKIDESASIDRDNTRTAFITYMQRAQLPINGVALYDENGKLTIIENRNDIRMGENQDFSKTSFIKWSKNPVNKSKTFISTPYIGTTGASVGKIIFIVAKPVYFGNKYKGTLSIRLLVNDFKNAFTSPLTSDAEEDIFIMNTYGILIAGNSALLNKDLFAYAREKKWSQNKDFTGKLNMILKNKINQTSWVFQSPKEKPTELLVGASRIDIPDTHNDLYMVATISRKSIVASLNPLLKYGLVWLGFGVLTTVVGGIIVMLLRSSE